MCRFAYDHGRPSFHPHWRRVCQAGMNVSDCCGLFKGENRLASVWIDLNWMNFVNFACKQMASLSDCSRLLMHSPLIHIYNMLLPGVRMLSVQCLLPITRWFVWPGCCIASTRLFESTMYDHAPIIFLELQCRQEMWALYDIFKLIALHSDLNNGLYSVH